MTVEIMYVIIPVALFFILLAIGFPIAFTLITSGFLGYALNSGVNASFVRLGSACTEGLANFLFSPIPMFIFMGEFVVVSGIGARLYEAAWRWVGRLPGGLCVATILACTLMAAMSGISVAGIVAIGVFAIPEITKRGYSTRFATGSLTGGSTLGILIPPSVPFILYGVLAEQSIGKLFVAGIGPGLLLSAMFIIYVIIFAIMNPTLAPKIPPIGWDDKIRSLQAIWPVAILIFLVLGSIYTGVASASEAAGLGALGALIIAIFYRQLTLKKLWTAIERTAVTTVFIFIIITGGLFFGYFVTMTGIVDIILGLASNVETSRWVIFLGINVVLIILGCMMDASSIIIITTPLLYPLIMKLGFDPIWYGVVLCINMEMSFITPPVGLNLFAMKGIFPDIEFKDILYGSLPYCILMGFCIVILSFFPEVALYLTKYVGN